jgi:hypothetical protein
LLQDLSHRVCKFQLLDLDAAHVSFARSLTVEKVICCSKTLLEIAQVCSISLAAVFCFCITRNLSKVCRTDFRVSDKGTMCIREYNSRSGRSYCQTVRGVHIFKEVLFNRLGEGSGL